MRPLRAILLQCGLVVAAAAPGRTCIVGPGGETSLRHALAIAAECDTVLVRGGEHREGTITIERPVVLLGEGRPVIDAQGAGDVLVVKAAHVTIRGFIIRGTVVSDMNDNAGIKCISVTDIQITDNVLERCFFGIHLSSVDRALVRDNRLAGDPAAPENRRANGIHLWKCAHIGVENNIVEHHRDGIYLEFVTDSHVRGNHSAFNARYGLHFMFSHRDAYSDNVFQDNGAGVAVMFTREVEMVRNRFERNRGASAYGLLLKEINDAHIEQNVFVDNTTGLLVDGCNRATIKGNIFRSNGWALRLFANSTGCVVSANTFGGNTFDVTTTGDLVLNTLAGNYWDRYQGYDLDRDGTGDVPHRPLGVFALVAERMPYAMVLSRSLLVQLLDQGERLLPSLTPKALEDLTPLMRPPHG